MITWAQRLQNLRDLLGREPTLNEKLKESAKHEMTPGEYEAQRQSWIRGMMPTGDPDFD